MVDQLDRPYRGVGLLEYPPFLFPLPPLPPPHRHHRHRPHDPVRDVNDSALYN